MITVLTLSTASMVTFAKTDRFDKKDANSDGKLSVAEYTAKTKKPEKAAKKFAKIDSNKDGFITREEMAAMPKKKKKNKNK